MELTKVISPELIRSKFSASVAFGKKVHESFPEIERMLNSAWKGVKDRPQITLALSEKWIAIENLQAEKYAVAVVKLDWKQDVNSKLEGSGDRSLTLTREFADKLISSISGTQFKCEVIEGKNNIIGGLGPTTFRSGIIIEVTRKSVLDNIIAASDGISYAEFNSERVELLQLLRLTDQSEEQQGTQESVVKKGPNYLSMERTSSNVPAIIGRLGGDGVVETFNTMRTELETSFNIAAGKYPDRIEEILEKAWKLTDGTVYDRLMVTKCALYIVVGSGDLATGLSSSKALRSRG